MGELTLFAYGGGWGDELLRGFGLTIGLSIVAFALGTGLGLAAALGELSGLRFLSPILQGYGAVVRSLPELLIIFLLYFGGSLALQALLAPFGFEGYVEVSAFWAGAIALAIIQGAYASEVFRGAILAVPRELPEAAASLGFKRWMIFGKVTLPVAGRFAFPGLCNLWMVVIKNTALVSAVGLEDLIGAAGTAGENTKHYFTFYFTVLVAYLLLSGATMAAQSALQGRLFRYAETGRSA
jgi:His/Glu/Gln/Arg/opine family amino acid ABC transporter permease subunit